MICSEVRGLCSDYLDDALDLELRRRMTEHLASCADCRLELDELRRSLKALRDTGPVVAGATFETTVVSSATRGIPLACVGRDQRYSEIYDRTAPAAERAEVQAHLAGCEGCREDYRVFTEGLQALSLAGPVSAPLGFERSLRQAPPAISTRTLLKVAAAFILAFTGGWLLQGRAAERDLMAAKAEIRSWQRKAENPAPPPDNTVRIDGRSVSIAEFLDSRFAAAGLVRHGNGWIPTDLKERLDRGEAMVDGKWIRISDEVERRARELAAASPGVTPSPGVSEADVLAKYDLKPFQGAWLPGTYIRELEAGRILTREGQWQDRDRLAAELLAGLNLVEHEGRWMTPEQQAQLLAAKRVVADPTRPESALTRALDGIEISAPVSISNLTLYPLIARKPADPKVVLLAEAMAQGDVDVIDSGAVLSVRVVNRGATPVLMLGGDLLSGGRSARMVVRDALVPKKATVDVAVYDVEPAAWRTEERFGSDSGDLLATVNLRRHALSSQGGQGAVWNETIRLIQALAPKATSPVMVSRLAVGNAHAIALQAVARDDREIVGFVIAVGDEIRWMELFQDRELCRRAAERILKGALLEARLPDPSDSSWPNSPQGAKQFLESLLPLGATPAGEDAIDIGAPEAVTGRAALLNGEILHLAAFADRLPPPPGHRAAVKIPKPKAAELLKQCEARLKSGDPAERQATFNELGSLPMPEVAQVLLAHLGDSNTMNRQSVIQLLGRRRETAAVAPLIRMLDEAKRESLLLPAVCAALSRIGDARAIDPMMKILDSKDADAIRAVAETLPELLFQIRDRQTLEKAVARLVDAVERSGLPTELPSPTPGGEPGPSVAGTLQAALRTLAGRDFATATDARMWWNREESRRKFLDERTK